MQKWARVFTGNLLLIIFLISQCATSVYSMNSDIEKYRIANTNQNFEEVERLFESFGIKKIQNDLKEESKNTIYSEDMNYIHEPFWSYNIIQLREYGKRIIEKLRPYFIEEASINKSTKEIDIKGNKVKVRKITEFGRILPLLHLKNQLEKENSLDKAVPRIFIIPNKKTEITFEFFMPYLKKDSRALVLDVGNNFLKVESDDFTMYQEYIKGTGTVGDRSFIQYGHVDLNAKQIITNNVDGKKYLIDTKESKNFYIPPLNPVSDSFYAYWTMKIGRILPQNDDEFQIWQRNQQSLILKAKKLHYPLNLPSIKVSVGKIDQLSPQKVQNAWSDLIFNDDSESEAYFVSPKDNLARYLKIRRYDLFLKAMDEYSDPSFKGVLVPGLFQHQETLIELGIDLLQDALSSKNKKDASLLYEIVRKLISKSENSVENEQVKLINLIAPKGMFKPEYLLSFEEGKDLLISLLKKRQVASDKLLNKAIIYSDISLLEVVLSFFSDEELIESTLRQIISTRSELDPFKQLKEGYKVQVLMALLHKLSKVSNDTVKDIFFLNNKEIIEKLWEKDFELGYALRSAVQIVKEPGRLILGSRWVIKLL